MGMHRTTSNYIIFSMGVTLLCKIQFHALARAERSNTPSNPASHSTPVRHVAVATNAQLPEWIFLRTRPENMSKSGTFWRVFRSST